MFGWLKNRALKNFSKMQREELQHFLDMLKGIDDVDLGLIVALAANLRNEIKDIYVTTGQLLNVHGYDKILIGYDARMRSSI